MEAGQGGFTLLEVMLNLLEPCYTLTLGCPGNNTRRQGDRGRSVTGAGVYQLQDHCVTLTIYIGYLGSKNAQISHLAQYNSI